jgi:hypothetical protein
VVTAVLLISCRDQPRAPVEHRTLVFGNKTIVFE